MKKIFILLTLCSGIISTSAQMRLITTDAIPDVFVPVMLQKNYPGGYLGDRRKISVSKRLMQLDLEEILGPYRQRPGGQAWVGEHVGKFLHASSLEYKFTADTALRRRLDYAAIELIKTQLPDGYLGTYLQKDYWTEWDVWSHKYNLIGLLSYYDVTGYTPALDACRKIGDLLTKTFGTKPGQLDLVAGEHGTHVGMAPSSVIEPMVQLFKHTGDKKYIDFCEYIVEAWEQDHGPKIISSILTKGSVFNTANGKAYEMMSCMVGLLELYRVTGKENYLKTVQMAWNDIRDNRLYLHGTASFHEHFKDAYALRPDGYYGYGSVYVGPGEGCVTVTWQQMNWQLFRLTGKQHYMEELEKLTYNALLGAQSPTTGKVCYFTPLEGRKRYGEVSHGLNPDISCCASSIPRGIALLPEFIAGKINNNIAVNLYSPSKFKTRVASGKDSTEVELEIKTTYPAQGNVDITVKTAKSATFKIMLNVPQWCTNFQVQVGNQKYEGKPGTYLEIERKWSNEWVRITMDMIFRLVRDNNKGSNKVAVFRGPQMLVDDRNISDVKYTPGSWFGSQFYRFSVLQKNENRTLILVPVAEAGQTFADYNALFEPFKFIEENTTSELSKYRDQLKQFHGEFGVPRNMPDVKFFLFGMGNRAKYLYTNGELKEALTGKIVRKFTVKSETIIPNKYAVNLITTDNQEVKMYENEEGVFIEENKSQRKLEGTSSEIKLPSFANHKYNEILKVLHHEILINVVDSKPVPNFFVYNKPWRRDGASMAMCLEKTGNVSLIKDWVLNLDDPYDHNNGEDEADNLGQTLVLLSYFADRNHPLVNKILAELPRFEVTDRNGKYIRGRSDGHFVPVYQTKWLKEGLAKLKLPDSYTIPKIQDDYSALYWWGYKDSYMKGTKDAPAWNNNNYPYIEWAADHFHRRKMSPLSNRDYPLTWEIEASQADYKGMDKIHHQYSLEKNSSPHTWHAAEVFLYLLDLK